MIRGAPKAAIVSALTMSAAMAMSVVLGAPPLATGAAAQLSEFCQFTGNPGACGPYDQYNDAIGQDLRMTLLLHPQGRVTTEPPAAAAPGPLPSKLNTIREVFAALRNCFATGLGAAGTQELSATIRFSFTRKGE